MPDPVSGFGGFTPVSSDPVKPTGFDAFVQTPLSRERGRSMAPNLSGFQGDSQYDTGLVPGMNQMRNRALNQPWYDQLGNSAVKLAPAIGLGILENAGYLGELLDGSHDYTNALTELAQQGREGLEEELPTYRENPGEVFDVGDSGWWMQHGMGLTESIGEFLVTGAGVGGILGKGAKGLSAVMKANRIATAGLDGAAQLGTAGFLAYTEGAMSGAQVYKQVLAEVDNPESPLYGNMEAAQAKAAEAAAHTVRLNTMINTGLNLSSVSPMFKTFRSLDRTSKTGLSRLPGEAAEVWEKRIDGLVAEGYQPANLRKALLLEAGQESTEEVVNLFAEDEGKIVGGIKQASSQDPLKRFLKTAFTEEGALSAMLGAIGGVGQTAGMELIPFRNYRNEDGSNKKVNNRELHTLEGQAKLQREADVLKADIQTIRTNQKALNDAIAAKDEDAIDKARFNLFNVSALRSIKEGVVEEFNEDLKLIAQTDNNQIGPDGLTEAMRKGYTDSQEDNSYKTVALERIEDMKNLSKEFEKLQREFTIPEAAEDAFSMKTQLYWDEKYLENIAKRNEEETARLIPRTRQHNILVGDKDSAIADVVNISANVLGLKAALENLSQGKNVDPRLINNLKNSLMVEDHLLKEALKADPELVTLLDKNRKVVRDLGLTRKPLIQGQAEMELNKGDYNEMLADPEKFEQPYKDAKEKAIKAIAKKEKDTRVAETKEAEKADKAEAKIKKVEKKEAAKTEGQQAKRVPFNGYVIIANEDGTVDVFDEEAGAHVKKTASSEEAFDYVRSITKPKTDEGKKEKDKPVSKPKAKRQTAPKKSKKEVAQEQTESPVIIEEKPKEVDNSYQELSPKDEEEVKEELNADVAKNSQPTDVASKIAYASREKGVDSGPILSKFHLIHSSKIKEGTPVILKVEEGKQEKGKEAIEIVTEDGKLIGYIALNYKDDPSLETLRQYVIANGTVPTKIASKGPGKMNWQDTDASVAEALPTVKRILIAKDGKLFSGPDQEYVPKSTLNQQGYKDSKNNGRTYVIIETPNGQEFALPVDTDTVSKATVASVMDAFRIYLGMIELTEAENVHMDQVFDETGIDIRTDEGFAKYFKTFFYTFDLTDAAKIVELESKKNDKRWVDWLSKSKGISFLRSGNAVKSPEGPQAKHVGKNTVIKNKDGSEDVNATIALRNGLLDELEAHLLEMHYNTDLSMLGDDAPLKYPIITVDENVGITVEKHKTYSDFVKANTYTKLQGEDIGDGEVTYFIGPATFIDTSFLGKPNEQNYGKPLEKPVENTTLTTEQPKGVFPSMTATLPKVRLAPEAVTAKTIEERKRYCS
jgi:hypothetical protein